MKRTVRCPARRSSCASATTRRRSATPALTAESASKCAPVERAMICGERRLPAAGRSPEDHRRVRRRARSRRAARGRRRATCSWPTNSSSVRGRMRAASGIASRANPSCIRAQGSPNSDAGSVSAFFGTLIGLGVGERRDAARPGTASSRRPRACAASGWPCCRAPFRRSCCACPASMCTVPSSSERVRHVVERAVYRR